MSLCIITIPTLLDTATSATHLRTQWARMYHYGHHILPGLAVSTSLLHSWVSFARASAGEPWAVFALASLTTVSIAPFTWVSMGATNRELFRLGEGGAKEPLKLEMGTVRELVVRWTWLHFVRGLLPAAGVGMAAVGTFYVEACDGVVCER